MQPCLQPVTRPQLTQPQYPAKRLSFLDLPAEIRNKIYRRSLVKKRWPDRIKGLIQPPLTLVNRQIRSEALPVYYGSNRFSLTIPTKPPLNEPDDWANFIRMFRVFKAGGSGGGRGTGNNLQFIRNLSCALVGNRESFWEMEVVLAAATNRRTRRSDTCEEWDVHFCRKIKYGHRAFRNRDAIYKFVKKQLGSSVMGDEPVMHESCIQRLISTIVMVATECPGIIGYFHLHANWRDEEEDFWSE